MPYTLSNIIEELEYHFSNKSIKDLTIIRRTLIKFIIIIILIIIIYNYGV